MAETDASEKFRADREEELQALQSVAERERRWTSMESSRKVRVSELAKMMSGAKPKCRRRGQNKNYDVRRLAKGAKLALREYATWVRDHRDELNAKQLECLSSLVGEWREVRLSDKGVKLCPPHDRLRELHQNIARSGAGDFESWIRYVAAVREVERMTDAKSGLPRTRTRRETEEEEEDEAYVDSRDLVNIEDVNDALQSRWNLGEEKKARVNEEKLREETAAKIKISEEAATKRRLETRENQRGLLDESSALATSRDDDGFVVVEDATPETFDKPAVLDGFSWTDDEATATLYVELSRPVRANELNVIISRDCLEVSHNNSLVIKRTFWRPVAAKDEDTLWFLEDSGDILRFELVKASSSSDDERHSSSWRCIFDGGGGRRSTRGEDQRLDWSQSEYDITVTAKVPMGTTKNDVKVTLRRDSIKIYVKASGILVDATLNRPINVKECTWVISSNELTVMLVKLHKKQPWQRLIAGGNEISIEDAHRQMGSEPPEHGDVDYDELDPEEQLYAEALREYKRAEARGDRELAQDILHEIDTNLPMVLQADPDRNVRSRLQKEGFE